LSGSGTDRDAASSLWLFEDLAPGTYDLFGSAEQYADETDTATLAGSEIVPVSMELKFDGSEGEGKAKARLPYAALYG
jgi:hypothetical protein